MTRHDLTVELAGKFARLALSHVTREYPNKLDHVINDATDLRSPKELHPIFYGSFDWHSCVHGYWSLATILRLFPRSSESQAIANLFTEHLTAEKVKAELDYLHQPLRVTFERPYGWAWLLMLAAELKRGRTDAHARWSDALQPLTEAFVDRFRDFLPKATYPNRVGTHFNTAFALSLASEYANEVGDIAFATLLADQAQEWYSGDVDCQAWEPSGDEFLSPALMEAQCMRRILDGYSFAEWLERFLPRLADEEPRTLFVPATVSDRSDGKIAHLDGLNLSRAWCWKSIGASWPEGSELQRLATVTAEDHLDASLPHVAGDYMGEHWLTTFALLALR
ncbi:MAG TPA: DUF2891 domain-containing protein [Gemmatimonadaceae bacterium]